VGRGDVIVYDVQKVMLEIRNLDTEVKSYGGDIGSMLCSLCSFWECASVFKGSNFPVAISPILQTSNPRRSYHFIGIRNPRIPVLSSYNILYKSGNDTADDEFDYWLNFAAPRIGNEGLVIG
jgi:hypothetical protein